MKNNKVRENGQFVISYELLQLLQWLVDNEPEALKDLVIHALDNGLHEQIINTQVTSKTLTAQQELQKAVIDFFTFLENEMIHAPENNEDTHLAHQSIIPAIDHIDTSICDETTLANSIAQTTLQLKKKIGTNAKEVFCKALLKNWNPQQDKRLCN